MDASTAGVMGGSTTAGVVTGATGGVTGGTGVVPPTTGAVLVATVSVVTGTTATSGVLGVLGTTAMVMGARSNRCAATKPKAFVGVAIFNHSPLASVGLTTSPFCK